MSEQEIEEEAFDDIDHENVQFFSFDFYGFQFEYNMLEDELFDLKNQFKIEEYKKEINTKKYSEEKTYL